MTNDTDNLLLPNEPPFGQVHGNLPKSSSNSFNSGNNIVNNNNDSSKKNGHDQHKEISLSQIELVSIDNQLEDMNQNSKGINGQKSENTVTSSHTHTSDLDLDKILDNAIEEVRMVERLNTLSQKHKQKMMMQSNKNKLNNNYNEKILPRHQSLREIEQVAVIVNELQDIVCRPDHNQNQNNNFNEFSQSSPIKNNDHHKSLVNDNQGQNQNYSNNLLNQLDLDLTLSSTKTQKNNNFSITHPLSDNFNNLPENNGFYNDETQPLKVQKYDDDQNENFKSQNENDCLPASAHTSQKVNQKITNNAKTKTTCQRIYTNQEALQNKNNTTNNNNKLITSDNIEIIVKDNDDDDNNSKSSKNGHQSTHHRKHRKHKKHKRSRSRHSTGANLNSSRNRDNRNFYQEGATQNSHRSKRSENINNQQTDQNFNQNLTGKQHRRGHSYDPNFMIQNRKTNDNLQNFNNFNPNSKNSRNSNNPKHHSRNPSAGTNVNHYLNNKNNNFNDHDHNLQSSSQNTNNNNTTTNNYNQNNNNITGNNPPTQTRSHSRIGSNNSHALSHNNFNNLQQSSKSGISGIHNHHGRNDGRTGTGNSKRKYVPTEEEKIQAKRKNQKAYIIYVSVLFIITTIVILIVVLLIENMSVRRSEGGGTGSGSVQGNEGNGQN